MAEDLLVKGSRGHLSTNGSREPIEVVDSCGKAVRVLFTDKPLLGGSPWCWLEFDDPFGGARYYTQICAATYDAADGLILVRVSGIEREGVREFARVPANLDVSLEKSPSSSIDANLLNISSGGALIESDGQLALQARVGIQLTLPGSGDYKVTGQVVHVEQIEPNIKWRYGIRFVEVQGDFLRALLNYLWLRLTELFPVIPKVRTNG